MASSIAAPLHAQVVVDGLLGLNEYGPALSTQTINTQFGDNQSELNQAFSDTDSGVLSVLTTGNLETNGNRFVTLFDTVNNVNAPVPVGGAGDFNQSLLAGSTFDTSPEYALFVNESFNNYFATLRDLVADTDVVSFQLTGDPNTGTATGSSGGLNVAWTNANTAGVTGGAGEPDANASTATSGIEFSLDKTLIGGPAGPINVSSFAVGPTFFYSNQFLGPLPDNTGNLGPGPVDLTAQAGDQFYTPFQNVINLPVDGNLGPSSTIFNHEQVNIYAGGSIGPSSGIDAGGSQAEVNLFDGSIGDNFSVMSGTANIAGGTVGTDFKIYNAATANMTGGTMGSDAINSATFNLAGGSVGIGFANTGIFNLSGGSVSDGFHNKIGTVHMTGGSIGADARNDNLFNISDGAVGNGFLNTAGGTVNMSGGSVGDDADNHGVFNLAAGSVGRDFQNSTGGTVDMTGGSIDIRYGNSGTINLSGGTVGNGFQAFSGSTVNVFGTQFILESIDITGTLTPGVPFTITDRNVNFFALLDDGSSFEILLRTGGGISGTDFFSPSATLTVTLTALPGDLDGDGFVGINDLNIVLGNWNQNVPPANPLADPSGDGFVGIDDLNAVLGNWNAGTPPNSTSNIPEPGGLSVLGIGGLALLRRVR